MLVKLRARFGKIQYKINTCRVSLTKRPQFSRVHLENGLPSFIFQVDSYADILQARHGIFAPFDSCPIPSLKIDAVFRRKISSNSSSNLEISAVGENEKPIRKDERRKDLEVICHQGLNNFCNMIVPLPKSQIRHPARAQAPLHLPHMLFDTKLYKPLPHVRIFLRLRGRPLRTKTACRELPEAFQRDLAITIGRRGRIL